MNALGRRRWVARPSLVCTKSFVTECPSASPQPRGNWRAILVAVRPSSSCPKLGGAAGDLHRGSRRCPIKKEHCPRAERPRCIRRQARPCHVGSRFFLEPPCPDVGADCWDKSIAVVRKKLHVNPPSDNGNKSRRVSGRGPVGWVRVKRGPTDSLQRFRKGPHHDRRSGLLNSVFFRASWTRIGGYIAFHSTHPTVRH